MPPPPAWMYVLFAESVTVACRICAVAKLSDWVDRASGAADARWLSACWKLLIRHVVLLLLMISEKTLSCISYSDVMCEDCFVKISRWLLIRFLNRQHWTERVWLHQQGRGGGGSLGQRFADVFILVSVFTTDQVQILTWSVRTSSVTTVLKYRDLLWSLSVRRIVRGLCHKMNQFNSVQFYLFIAK